MNKNMKKAREQAGLSQKQVAITLKVSAPTVSDWESGKIYPTASNLKALSVLYNVPTDYLLGQIEDDTYIEPNTNNLHCNNPISALSAQYHVSTAVFSSITGAHHDTVEDWILGQTFPNDNELAKISEFFEISIQELRKGSLPLFPKESVQLRVLELTDIRFAAYGKDGDYTVEELKKIKEYAELIRHAKGGREIKEVNTE